MSGPGRLIAAVYALLALAAGARSGVQIATDFSAAPLPYTLSAVAAAVYLLIALTISSDIAERRRIARYGCRFELAGVLCVGIASLLDPGAFPDQTVWSGFGAGYGWVPLALPCVGLAWLQLRRDEVHAGRPPCEAERSEAEPRRR